MRRITVACALFAGLAVIGQAALASSVHLKGGSNAKPTFTDNGLTLTASGALAGLGNADILVKLAARGNATAVCINPSGGNQPPGQNPAPVTLSGTEPIPRGEIKNGEVSFRVATAGPTNPIPGAPGCPNRHWTERITNISFTSATITVEQPVGTRVLAVSCNFSQPTANGTVPSGNVTCTTG
jgi:hypothetical protein